ncbi:MAG: hypothetical protein V7676_17750 [Parasphingorhabdus sp.]|uniref:hypothetical protein n=2 Tax=Parasphingorhabdus sp. TaxID=2709688 RepID=UPI0030029C67
MDEENTEAVELYHPPFVVRALDWIEGISSEQLIAAAQIKDQNKSGFIPPAALVRIIRRFRTDGKLELSDRLVAILITNAYDYVRRVSAGFEVGDREDVIQETMQTFLTELAENDGIDWWEVTFHRELRRRASDAYARLIGRHRKRSAELTDDQEFSDDGEAAAALQIRATLVAFADKRLKTEEHRRLFLLLMLGDLPIDAPEAPNDLVRLTGKPRSTLANLKTDFTRMLKAALVEKAS